MTPAVLQKCFDAGVCFQQQNRLHEAAKCYESLLPETAHVALVHYNLGLVYRAQGQIEAAASAFREAARLKPALAEAHVNLANVLYTLGDLTAAEQSCREALRLAPHLNQAYANLGNILRDQGQLDASVAAFELALAHWPDDPKLHNDLGNTLKSANRLKEAEAAYSVALQQQPGSPHILYNLGILHLTAGRFAQGWAGHEYRWQTGVQGSLPFAGPSWQGEAGPAVLIYAEQGLGDTIQFCRYVQLAAERVPVTFLVPPELKRLVADIHPNVKVITSGDAIPDEAIPCALQSLPLVFDTRLDTIPAKIPYLCADAAAVAHWRDRLAILGGLHVGIVWAGNPSNPNDHRRSIAGDDLARLRQPGVTLVSLQKGHVAGPYVCDWTSKLNDLADTAALIDALDLVIGVDTAVVHLAGALGKPVWLLNRFDTDWRWLVDRDDSPWYPTLRQFRQSSPGDWATVLDQVSTALGQYAGLR